MRKLTLSIDKATVHRAKKIAQANNTSVSAMFSQYVQSVAQQNSAIKSSPKIGPLTRKLSGIVKLPTGKSDKEALADALARKFRL